MSIYAGAAALGAAILLGSKHSAAPAAPTVPPPVWARMRWIDFSWQLILPMAGMHPPPPPGQQGTTRAQKSSGVWLFWKIGPNGYAVNMKGQSIYPKIEKGVHEIGRPVAKPGEYLYIWYPRFDQLQSINGYWIYHSRPTKKGQKADLPPPPPSAGKGHWTSRAGGHNRYLVWLTKSQSTNVAKAQKQFAWFTFHHTKKGWFASKIIATSPNGLNLPDEVDASGAWIFVLTPQQAAADAAVLRQPGNSQPPNAAPPPTVAPAGQAAAQDRLRSGRPLRGG